MRLILDYHGMMELSEEMISATALKVLGTDEITYQGQEHLLSHHGPYD